jgi:hypothetical protein
MPSTDDADLPYSKPVVSQRMSGVFFIFSRLTSKWLSALPRFVDLTLVLLLWAIRSKLTYGVCFLAILYGNH